MREEPIYPQKFGRGIPNPVGPATFRGLQHAGRVQKMPDIWGPLVSSKLDYSTNTASFSQHQLRDISKSPSLSVSADIFLLQRLQPWGSLTKASAERRRIC